MTDMDWWHKAVRENSVHDKVACVRCVDDIWEQDSGHS